MWNICTNLALAWWFKEPTITKEPWQKKKIEMSPLSGSFQQLNGSIGEAIINVANRFLSIIKNTLLWSEHDIFFKAQVILKETNGNYRPFCYVPTLLKNYAFVTDQNYIEAILKHDRNETGVNALFGGGFPSIVSKRILGDNLLSFHDDKHAQKRKALTSFFSLDRDFADKIETLFCKTFNSWYEKNTFPLKVFPFLPVLVLQGVCTGLLQYDDAPCERIFQTTETILNLDRKQRTLAEETYFQAALQTLEDYANEALKSRKCHSLLLSHTKEEAKNFIKLMFFAGIDTTAVLLEYLLFILGHSEHKSYQDLLYEKWTSSDLKIADFVKPTEILNCLIIEALRLHPPSFEQTRIALQDFVLDNTYVVPQGTELHLFHFYAQRDIQRWGQDADKFNPYRYTTHTNTLMTPFSFGPTSCLGKNFTMHFVKLFLMHLVANYEWTTITECRKVKGPVALKIEPDAEIVLSKRAKSPI